MLALVWTTSGRKFSSKKRRAARLSPSFTAAAVSQICFHSPGAIVFCAPSTTILLSGAAISLGQERRKAASASSCLSSVQPPISLNEIGAMPTLFSVPPPPAHADRRPAAASMAAPPDKTLQRMRNCLPLAFAFSLHQLPVGIAGLGVAAEHPEIHDFLHFIGIALGNLAFGVPDDVDLLADEADGDLGDAALQFGGGDVGRLEADQRGFGLGWRPRSSRRSGHRAAGATAGCRLWRKPRRWW